MTVSGPRPDEPDIQLTFRLYGIRCGGKDRHGRQTDDLRIRALPRAPRRAEGKSGIERFLRSDRPHPPTFLYWIDSADKHPAAGRYLITVDS